MSETKNPATSYNPEKLYEWEPEDMFTLDGKEFSMVYNSLLAYVNSAEVRKVMTMVRTFETMQAKFKHYVETGVIKEKEEDPAPMAKTMEFPVST